MQEVPLNKKVDNYIEERIATIDSDISPDEIKVAYALEDEFLPSLFHLDENPYLKTTISFSERARRLATLENDVIVVTDAIDHENCFIVPDRRIDIHYGISLQAKGFDRTPVLLEEFNSPLKYVLKNRINHDFPIFKPIFSDGAFETLLKHKNIVTKSVNEHQYKDRELYNPPQASYLYYLLARYVRSEVLKRNTGYDKRISELYRILQIETDDDLLHSLTIEVLVIPPMKSEDESVKQSVVNFETTKEEHLVQLDWNPELGAVDATWLSSKELSA